MFMSVADIEKDALSAQLSFLFACEQEDIALLSQYLEPTPTHSYQTHYKTGLNVTIIHNRLNTLKYLLAKIKYYHLVDFNKENDLLLEACQYEREEIVYFLLSKEGLEPYFTPWHLQQALEKCCFNGNFSLVEYFREHYTLDYSHALYLATFNNHQKILDYLIINYPVELSLSYLTWLNTSQNIKEGVEYAKKLLEKRQLKEKLICLPLHPQNHQRKI